jgi:hypothetical protein
MLFRQDGRWIPRTSSRGFPYQVWQPPVPWIDPNYLESVVYLYPSEADAEDGNRIGGSGFLVVVPVIAIDRPIGGVACVVTNQHVIHSGNMVVRINTVDGGKDIIALDGVKWYSHPDGDDVAVCPIQLAAGTHRFRCVPTASFLTKQIIDMFEIGPGDETFVIGRFVNHEGKQRNVPSVRFGNISQMPGEPIVIDGYRHESFLVEARSISGYSGSPVFVYLPPQVDAGLDPQLKQMVTEGKLSLPGVSSKRINIPIQLGPWLLGIDFCHIRWDEPVWSRLTKNPVSDDWFIKSNTGMMGVVPAWKLHEVLEGPEMKPLFDKAKRFVEQTAKVESVVVLDAADLSQQSSAESSSSDDANPHHLEDFTRLVDVAARKRPRGDQT